MKTTIWCLFSISNEYDQPKNNLQCAWTKKPSHEELKSVLVNFSVYVTDVNVNDIRKKGKEVRFDGYYHFRLQEITIGQLLTT